MTLQWRKLFFNRILDQGRDYWKRDWVYAPSYSELPAGVHCRVGKPGQSYDVTIDFSDDWSEIKWMDCDCPYAAEGYNCKHEAACLYATELFIEGMQAIQEPLTSELPVSDRKKRQEEIIEKVYGLGRKYVNYIFDPGKILASVDFDPVLWERIWDNPALAHLVAVNLDDSQANDKQPLLTATGFSHFANRGNGNKVNVKVGLKQVSELKCNIAECKQDEITGPCRHEIALLQKLALMIMRENPGEVTDYQADRALARAEMLEEFDQDALEDVKLLAQLEKEPGGSFLVKFKVGQKRLYVVKNIQNFVDDVLSWRPISLGKEEVLVSPDSFDPASQRLFSFLATIAADGADIYGESKRSIEIASGRIDGFFAAVEGSEVENLDNKQVVPAKWGELEKAELEIDVYRGRGISITGICPPVLRGIRASYQLTDEAFVAGKLGNMLYALFGNKENIDVSFDINQLSQFKVTVLPLLKKYSNLTISPAAQQLLEEAGGLEKSQLRLDVEGDEVVGQARVFYQGKAVRLGASGERAIKRDWYKEEKLADLLEKFFDLEDGDFRLDKGDDEAVYQLLEGMPKLLAAFDEVEVTPAFKKLKLKDRLNLAFGLSLSDGLLRLDLKSELTPEELAEVFSQYKDRKKYIRLKNGSFLNPASQDLEKLALLAKNLDLAAKDFGKEQLEMPAYRALYVDQLLKEQEMGEIERDDHFQQLLTDFDQKEALLKLPTGLEKILRPYQKTGTAWMNRLAQHGFGGILADEMGLGKTLQVISLLGSQKDQPSLIVAPASLVLNWEAEFKKFAPEMKTLVLSGSKKERSGQLADLTDIDVVITSYDLLKRDIANYEPHTFAYEVIDEAQMIKNPRTAAAKAVSVVKAKHRFALTGTPIENRLSELWSIFNFVMPGFLKSYREFKKDFESPIVKEDDQDCLNRLSQMVGPFILRRLKKDVLKDLPDKLEEVRYVGMGKEQKKLYDAEIARLKNKVMAEDDEGIKREQIEILAALTRIREICCDPGLLYEDYKGESEKRRACVDLIKSAIDGGHKVLLFSQFTSMLDLLEESLKAEEIVFLRIDGQTPKARRMTLVNVFNHKDSPAKVFLISLKAGGTGLNLTGADTVIHYDPWWNVAAQNQATDRAHRIGQEKKVTVYKLIAKDTVEEAILDLQEAKSQLAQGILTAESVSSASLQKEDLLKILD
ncbi:DEAD/DEAH box helicase [Lactobacillus delbrueckii]|uniref:DEAD/DEAH box helicase n=1 Tax=Lactobacillus delbrueckii TaxID=1584 RepID=UPI001F1856EB|nr:DEAD/DEAH box helicase [Lactobacillus delbrueckii]MDK8261135.1 DEAD/DEAH box helicase [Lactobacillus delbrueckii]GHN15958.1 SNF2 family DNA/RNA helicase [Lactobacillus delbrueckii]